MGQQQLLLLVLGIVIVGLAVVAGINAFQENQTKSSKDALINEGMRIATDIQSYKLKPSELGGGGGSYPTNLNEVIADSLLEETNRYDTPWGDLVYDGANKDLKVNPAPDTSTTAETISLTSSGPSLD